MSAEQPSPEPHQHEPEHIYHHTDKTYIESLEEASPEDEAWLPQSLILDDYREKPKAGSLEGFRETKE